MPEDRKVIAPSLLRFSEDSKRILPHTNKCVFYSIFVHCLYRLQESLCLSAWHVLALITNVIISETPEYFRDVTEQILASNGKELCRYRSLGPVDLALDFYERVFVLKVRASSLGLKVVGQRHQPHYNKRPPETTVIRSIHNFFELYKAMDHVTDKLAQDPFFFCRAVAYLEAPSTTTGVHGVGGLSAQHLVHISCLCGFFPSSLMNHAEIGVNTSSYSYLYEWEGLTEHKEDTRQLLACTGARCNLTAFEAENLICKFGQSQEIEPPKPKVVARPVKPKLAPRKSESSRRPKDKRHKWRRKSNPYRDSLYRDQHIYYLSSIGQLAMVTRFGSSFDVNFIAESCTPLSDPHLVPLQSVPVTYWDQKVIAGRLNPMKDGTRSRWKASQSVNESATRQPLQISVAENKENLQPGATPFEVGEDNQDRTAIKKDTRPKRKRQVTRITDCSTRETPRIRIALQSLDRKNIRSAYSKVENVECAMLP